MVKRSNQHEPKCKNIGPRDHRRAHVDFLHMAAEPMMPVALLGGPLDGLEIILHDRKRTSVIVQFDDIERSTGHKIFWDLRYSLERGAIGGRAWFAYRGVEP